MLESSFLLDDIDFSEWEHETDAKRNVKPVGAWVDELINTLRNPDKTRKIHLPWEKARDVFHFRSGEVTLWAGQNGHGKTQAVSQQVLSLLGQDQKVVIASFEMKPVTTINLMARMYAGVEALVEILNEFRGWAGGRLWLYDQQGTAKTPHVLGMARYAAKELGCGHVVIDSLMKCVQGEDDYNGQKAFVDELTALARDNGVHVHLVHHTRKPINEAHIPDKHDNKGSGAITDLVDNVLMLWRNKAKEDDIKANGAMAKKASEPDAYLLCRKQRNGEDEPTIKLWFDRDSKQFKGEQHDPLMFFPNYPHRPT
jgi:twinkle protein